MLELAETTGAFRALEEFLADEQFFMRRGVVADLFLASRLSEAIRRTETPSPPEPCRLPALACRIRPSDTLSLGRSEAFVIGEWVRTWDDDGYARAIEAVRAAIARGDVYQVNLVQHLSAPFEGDPAGLAGALASLRPLVPRPFVTDEWAIVSASPELFLAKRGRRVWTSPIKGTRPLGEEGLADSEKDRAENVMIVDLERNDLSRVCEPGSVRWPELMAERELAGVVHLVSTVEGTLRA